MDEFTPSKTSSQTTGLSPKQCLGGLVLAGLMALAPGCGLENRPDPNPVQAAEPSPSDSIVTLAPPDGANPWPAEWEAQYRDRARTQVARFADPKAYGNTYFENEKKSYPRAMLDWLNGNRERAIAFLQAPDALKDSTAHTFGVDFYPSFTLKGQVRKYFYFGAALDPDYRETMRRAMRVWTAGDPLERRFERPQPFWNRSRDTCQTWVDCRNTDNLRAMREVAVYLFAEEVGSEATRQIYAQRLRRYVSTLYSLGMGEWDSSNYHGHTLTSYLNLYDFAKDPEIKALAKSALDWLSVAAALKYWRGAWAGPSKRDSGGLGPWKALASAEVGLWFGEGAAADDRLEPDILHVVTSGYRPPRAAVDLARKQFPKPLELANSKPTYENWKPGGADRPTFYETLYFGETFQWGSLAQGGGGDVNGFKLLVASPSRGVDTVVMGSGRAPEDQPSKIVTANHQRAGDFRGGGDNIVQAGRLLLWLNGDGRTPMQILLPETARWIQDGKVTFIEFERTWLALWLLNLSAPQSDRPATAAAQKRYPQTAIFTAQGLGRSPVAGLALEIGEAASHGSFDRFRQAVRDRAQVQADGLENGDVTLVGSQGDRLRLVYGGRDLPQVWHNGQARPWEQAVYRTISPGETTLNQGWKSGRLSVVVGGDMASPSLRHRFLGQVR